MKKDFEFSRDYTVRKLNPENDWEIFRDHLSRTHGENNYTWVLENEDYSDFEMWQSEMRRFIQFGLFYGEDLVGSTELYFRQEEQDFVFTGSVIEAGHRGIGLADQLYEARIQYVRQTGYAGHISVEIQDNNDRSLKAAKRNGFEEAREIVHSGDGYYARYIALARQP